MASDGDHLAWLAGLDAYMAAAAVHDANARCFARLGKAVAAERESKLAAAQRRAHGDELLRHPDWKL
jgi:hypothetical protein